MIDFNSYDVAIEEYPQYHEVIEFSKSQWATVPSTGKVVVVNIPAAEVWLIKDLKRVKTLNAIVGKASHQTPIMTDNIRYIELNPKWYVPMGIARRDLVPKMISRPDMVNKQGFRFFSSDWHAIDYHDIDWQKIEPKKWNYKIVQDPGWANAMGELKFMFPNDKNIYLHDTPDKTLFKLPRYRRTLSSGCVRVQQPLTLAKFLTNKDLYNRLRERKSEDSVNLNQPIPVKLLYMPIWVDENLDVNFGYDFYDMFENYKNPEPGS